MNNNQLANDKAEIRYNKLKEQLLSYLINVKGIKFKELIDQHFSLPIDRISRFLKMIKNELDLKHA